MVIPQDGELSVCRCADPAYPLSPTRCWRYHFSYLDSGGDCGLGRCKRPAEARCLPLCRSPRQGSRMLNPLLNSQIQKWNDFPRWKGRQNVCPQVSQVRPQMDRSEDFWLNGEQRTRRSSWTLTPSPLLRFNAGDDIITSLRGLAEHGLIWGASCTSTRRGKLSSTCQWLKQVAEDRRESAHKTSLGSTFTAERSPARIPSALSSPFWGSTLVFERLLTLNSNFKVRFAYMLSVWVANSSSNK